MLVQILHAQRFIKSFKTRQLAPVQNVRLNYPQFIIILAKPLLYRIFFYYCPSHSKASHFKLTFLRFFPLFYRQINEQQTC